MPKPEPIPQADLDRAREYAEKQDWRGLDKYLWDMSQTRRRGIPISFALQAQIAAEYPRYDQTAWCDDRCAMTEAVTGRPCANWRPGIGKDNKPRVAKGPLFGGDAEGVQEIGAGVPF